MRPSVFVVCLLDAFTPDLHLLLRGESQIKLIIWWVCRMYRMFRFLQKSNFLCHMRAQNDEEMFPHVLWFCCFSLGSFSDVDVNDSEGFLYIYFWLMLRDRAEQCHRRAWDELWEKIQKKSLVNILLLLLSVICSQAAVVKLCQKNVTILFICVYFGF